MNEFKRVQMMNDRRWTVNTKCDILENVMKLSEAEKNARHAGMDVELKNQIKYLQDLKKDIKNFNKSIKDANTNYKETILSGIEDRTLVEKYRDIHPEGIKMRIDHSIHKIRYESNLMRIKIDKKKDILEKIQAQYYSKQQVIKIDSVDTQIKVTLSKIADMDKKIALVDFNNRKTEKMIDLTKQNVFKFDLLIEQLQNDSGEMARNIMKQIEIGTYFKEDSANYIQNKIDEKAKFEKRMYKDMFRIDQLNSIMDSLEHNRRKLIKTKSVTEEEEKFYLELPVTSADNELYLGMSNISSTSSTSLTSVEHTNWVNQMSEFGMMHFIDEDYKQILYDNIRNNIHASSIEYTFPDNLINYITFDDTVPTKDELAVNYVLTELKFNNIEDFTKNVEWTKNNLVKMKKFKTVRKTLWNILLEKSSYIQEATENLNLMTNKEIKYNKQKEILKAHIVEQNNKINEYDLIKTRYLKLFNDMFFYTNNIRNILNKINFSDDDTKRYSNRINTPQDEIFETPNKDITILLGELKSMLSEIEGKIRWCNIIIPDDFNPDNLNMAYALYAFKVQAHIQEDLLKKRKKVESTSRKKVYEVIPNTSNEILTRQDVKREAEQIIKYFNEKDLDTSKNKRKPISFRKSFI